MQDFTAPTAGGATSYLGFFCGTNHLVEWHLLADVNTTVWSLGQHLMVTQPEWLYIIALIQSIIKLSSKWQTARLEVKLVMALCECLSSSHSLSSTVSAIHLPSFVLTPLILLSSLSLTFDFIFSPLWLLLEEAAALVLVKWIFNSQIIPLSIPPTPFT